MLKGASYPVFKGAPAALRPENSGALDAFKQSTAAISDFTPATTVEVDAKIAAHVALADPHAQYATEATRPWITIFKTTDESRNTTTTLAADGALVVPLGVGKWTIRTGIFAETANAAMGFKFDFDFTGTGTLTAWRLARAVPGVVGGTDNETIKFGSGSLGGPFNMTAATFGTARVELEIIVTVTVAGSFRFLWAQGTSDAAACIVRAGSYLEYALVA